MATKIIMPQLGESVTEGTISKWLVKIGDRVEQFDSICEVITDKVNAEIPSSFSGTIVDIVAEEGETIEVGGLICYIEEVKSTDVHISNENDDKATQIGHTSIQATEQEEENMTYRYSPAVLKLSQMHNLDLSLIKGSGRGGRITRKDILLYVEEMQRQDPDPVPQKGQAPRERLTSAPFIRHSIGVKDVEIPVTPIRRTIAQKLAHSVHEAVHAWTIVEVDVTELVQYRQRVKAEFKEKEGINLTYLPFFVKATVEALQDYPLMNSQWAGDKIIQKRDINISISVGTDDALFVPVIKHADEKSNIGLARAIHELAEKTRAGILTDKDVEGGTFTVNNTGTFGSIMSQPIINYPQAAILSVEKIVKRPVIKQNMIAIRDMVNLCLSFDHRILDGVYAGRFLQSIKQKLEHMGDQFYLY